MTVFAVHPLGSKTDVSSALVYGDIEYINHRYIFSDEINDGQPPPGFWKNVYAHLGEFRPNMDYLLIAGDHLQLVMVTAWLAKRWDDFRVLRYDREAQGYVAVRIGGN